MRGTETSLFAREDWKERSTGFADSHRLLLPCSGDRKWKGECEKSGLVSRRSWYHWWKKEWCCSRDGNGSTLVNALWELGFQPFMVCSGKTLGIQGQGPLERLVPPYNWPWDGTQKPSPRLTSSLAVSSVMPWIELLSWGTSALSPFLRGWTPSPRGAHW